MNKIQLPAAFVDQMKESLGTEWPSFYAALQEPTPTSIRKNLYKSNTSFDHFSSVPWNEQAHYLPERPIFTLDPLFHAGTYYVQEASSMLIGAVTQEYFPENTPIKALDLCGAPGGKSTLLADTLPKGSLLLANEVIAGRAKILKENLTKWGQPNTFCSQQDSKDFKKLTGYFDLILVDAPCSGEGLFRKTPGATDEWSTDHVQLCSSRQKRILAEVLPLLAPGGILIYSTCTYNPYENTENAKWLCDQGLTHQSFSFPTEWGLVEKEFGYQCYPHRVKGEGFYFAVFQADTASKKSNLKVKASKNWQKLPKKQLSILGDWIERPENFTYYQNTNGGIILLPSQWDKSFWELKSVLPSVSPPSFIGEIGAKGFIPDHGLAMSIVQHPQIPGIELDESTAIQFLKKEAFPRADNLDNGWALVKFQGHSLGFVKVLKNRINNYYPKNWRIRMQVPKIN